MIVGFTVTDYKGHEKIAVEFIRKYCILSSPDIAQNIVNAGPGVNIYSDSLTAALVQGQPFLSTLIETRSGRSMVVSTVNITVELTYNGRIKRLLPTEYFYIAPTEKGQFDYYKELGLIKIID